MLVTRQPLVLEDVGNDPRFARDVAESTGYVPQGLMCVPLLHEEKALGVLKVLDRASQFTLEEMELLGLFANQAAIALDLLQRARRAQAVLAETGRRRRGAGARRGAARGRGRREPGRELLGALERLLKLA